MIPVVRRDWFTYRHYCEIVEKYLYSNGTIVSTKPIKAKRHHLLHRPDDAA